MCQILDCQTYGGTLTSLCNNDSFHDRQCSDQEVIRASTCRCKRKRPPSEDARKCTSAFRTKCLPDKTSFHFSSYSTFPVQSLGVQYFERSMFFFWKSFCGAPGLRISAIFATIDLHPLYFSVHIFRPPPICLIAQMCYFWPFLVVPLEK